MKRLTCYITNQRAPLFSRLSFCLSLGVRVTERGLDNVVGKQQHRRFTFRLPLRLPNDMMITRVCLFVGWLVLPFVALCVGLIS